MKNPFIYEIEFAEEQVDFWQHEVLKMKYLSEEWLIVKGILRLCLTGK